MASLKIEKFLEVQNIYRDRSVSFGVIPGNGCTDGYGSGSGLGYGFRDGDGHGDGYVCGNGYGVNTGSGFGDGDGYEVKALGNKPVYMIDDMPTIIDHVHGNIAKGSLLNTDLTLIPCYIIKERNRFAHGITLQEAQIALMKKLFEDMDVDKRIDLFLKEFDTSKTYPVSRFFEWHNKLTGSCEMGRKQFAQVHRIDLENGLMTVSEFIGLTSNSYGSEVIKRLEAAMANTVK